MTPWACNSVARKVRLKSTPRMIAKSCFMDPSNKCWTAHVVTVHKVTGPKTD